MFQRLHGCRNLSTFDLCVFIAGTTRARPREGVRSSDPSQNDQNRTEMGSAVRLPGDLSNIPRSNPNVRLFKKTTNYFANFSVTLK